jgi:hypothetical protein
MSNGILRHRVAVFFTIRVSAGRYARLCRVLDFVLKNGLDIYILRRIGSSQPSPLPVAELQDWDT